MEPTPIFVETEYVLARLQQKNSLLVDLSNREHFERAHIPGAIHLDYALLIDGRKPAPGQVPDRTQLERLAGTLGLRPNLHVISCDDEGGGRAARLLWTLHLIGHRHASVINGGMTAWHGLGLPTTADPTTLPITVTTRISEHNPSVLADRTYILTHLDDGDVVLLDARSPAEFAGDDVRAERGGHIPGARNMNWLDTIDAQNHRRLHSVDRLRTLLDNTGISPAKEIIVYCQTHHRSAHTYAVLKHLGYQRARGYAGSWAEWGNDPTTPVG